MKINLMDKLAEARRFLNSELWDLDPASFSVPRRLGLKLLRVGMLVIQGFKEDMCPMHASALTFTTVMALVPFLVILFALAKAFGFEQASAKIMQMTADMPETFQHAVTNILHTVESASAGTLGSIGTVLFLWVAIKMLSSIEDTFNLVWGVKTPRPFLDKVRNYIFIMAAAPVLLIVANAGLPVILGFAGRLAWMGPALTFALQLIPMLVMALAFTIVYVFLPHTKVKFSAAFTGALLAAVMSILFQFAVITLGIGVSKYNKIYGTLAAIPLFLFWLQTSWMILLMGAEAAFSVQHAGTYARERLAVNPSARSRLCLAFALMKKITAAFESGRGPFDVNAYGEANRIPVRLVNDVIRILAVNGLAAEDALRPGCYTLVRDPALVSARTIADAVLNEGADPDELGMKDDFPMFGKITGESFQTLEKQILKSF